MTVRLRFLLRERDVRGATTEQVLSVYRDHGVVPKAGRNDNFNKTPENLSLYKLVLPGDVVVNKMKAWQGSIAVSDHRGIVSGDYLVCAVADSVHGRYLHHLLRSRLLINEYARRAKGIRPSQWRIYWDDLADIAVDLPSVGEQRAIANFLDAETARIDALIAKKRRLIDLAEEWLDGMRTMLLAPSTGKSPLKYLTDPSRPIMYGIVLPGPDVPDGVPIVKGGDVARGLPGVEGLCRTTAGIEAGYVRSRLRSGDLLFAIRGGVGDVAVVPPDVAGANITQDVARISPSREVDRRWLLHVLCSRVVQTQASVRTTGATIRGLNIWELKRIKVPVVPRGEQVVIGEALDDAQAITDRACESLQRQIDLLVEHRQALITAAVTGELAVPGVAA